jgi:transcriptional regulator GlxA family with amidase domain
MDQRDPLTVAVLVFDGQPLFETSVPISVFGIDRSESGVPRFDVRPVAGEPGRLRTTAGIEVIAPHDLAALDDAAVVIVPSWRDPAQRPPRPALAALTAAHAGGATVVGLCLGAFVLAAAGILDGRRAATHWRYAAALASQYPDVRVDASVLFVDDGDVLTSAGTAAGIDACLHLVRRRFGAGIANAIARRMVVPPQRAGGQAQYIDRPLPADQAGDPLGDVLGYALRHLDDPGLDVDALATQAVMSRRSFDRRFRQATGSSALQWLLTQRIIRAQHLLEATDLGVDAVARKVGFASGIALRPHFRRMVGVAPQAYREAFHAQGS